MKIKHHILLGLFLTFPLLSIAAEPAGRYFLEGDGWIQIVNSKTGAQEKIHYRTQNGTYPEKEIQQINRIFGVSANSPEGISLRLVALLDYLQDHFKSNLIRIISGYRSPEYNENLRKNGKLAAKTSMHIEGMAADIEMAGIDGRKLWEYVRSLDCCGAGYYHGKGIHIDIGPSRFWDETSTKIEQDLGAHNKLILLRTDQDIYHPGETVHFTLARITDYPIGVRPQAVLMKGDKEIKKIDLVEDGKKCVLIRDRKEARSLVWRIQEEVNVVDKVQIRFDFCEKPFPEMQDKIESNPIKIP